MSQDARSIGFSGTCLDRVRSVMVSAVEADTLMGAAVQVSRGGVALPPMCVGRRQLAEDGAPVEADTIFLIASITKPIVAAAVARLIEEGEVSLDDYVVDFVPDFSAEDKARVPIRHLLTHTSGLADQIPENHTYREAHRPVRDFVTRICELPLAFEPGTKISYQSCGIAMLGEIVERIKGISLPTYLDKAIFAPLGLKDTRLGVQTRSARESDVRIAGEGLLYGVGTNFDWNSDYWRGFGAPWGGMLTTVGEMTRLMLAFRNGGELEGARILGERTVAAMVADHSSVLPGLDSVDRARQRWGLGWRLGGRNSSGYGDLTSYATFGHGGATGTVAWFDPESDVSCVIFTNDPAAASWLRPRISNVVMGAVV